MLERRKDVDSGEEDDVGSVDMECVALDEMRHEEFEGVIHVGGEIAVKFLELRGDVGERRGELEGEGRFPVVVETKSGDGRAGRKDLGDEESIDGGGNVEVEGVELMMEDERRIGEELEFWSSSSGAQIAFR